MTIYIQQLMKEITDLSDRFHTLVYGEGDVAAATAMLDPGCELRNLPVGTGGVGPAEVQRYLAVDLVPHRPADLAFRRVSQTGDRWRVAEEMAVSFTHDRELPWLLPGIAPTHRRVEVSVMSMVGIRKSLIVSHRSLWDLHGLAAQLGVSDQLTSSVVSGG